MRVTALMLLLLLLLSNCACGRKPQPTNEAPWKPITTVPGGLRRDLVGDSRLSGPFKYQLKLLAGTRAPAHKHSTDVHVKVLSGSILIIIGEPLEPSRAQRFAAGSTFMVPAHASHEEWWDEETVLEAEGVGPMNTVYKSQ